MVNNKFLYTLLFSIVAIIVFFSSSNSFFVNAFHFANISGGISYTLNEDTYSIFNISINNTDINQDSNITQVNISLFGNFNFLFNSNGTDSGSAFTNTSNILTWTNTSGYVINGSQTKYFWFNATSSTPGLYNITIATLNGSGVSRSNLTIKVNDTNAPIITLLSPADGSTTLSTAINFTFNISDDLAANCSLILNGAKINFNSSVNKTGGITIFINASTAVNNTWSINCTDTDNNKGNSSTYNVYVPSFYINGTIYDVNANVLNNSNISVTIKDSSFSQITVLYGVSNASGWFSLPLVSNTSYMYQLSITRTNSTSNSVDWVGQTLPTFPYPEFIGLTNVNYYLKQAGTLNITVLNSTNVLTANFAIQVKDTKLGYPVGSCSQSGVSQICYVPKNRNYSIMVYPSSGGSERFVPVSFNWNNFSASSSYNLSDNIGANRSYYNSTTSTIHKSFNATQSFARITGYIGNSTHGDYADWRNFTVVPFLSEPGNMIFMSYGTLPWNASAWNNGQSDNYTLNAGGYNISLPYSPSETVNYILFAAAQNDTFYGGYKNITVSGDVHAFNFTMYGLLGTETIINMSNSTGGVYKVNTKKQTFNMLNSTNSTLNQFSAHVETTVDYSNYGSTQFTFMEEISASGASSFSLPLLNITGTKETNVYSQTYAPKRISTRTADQIIANPNITMKSFTPEAVSGSFTEAVNISAYTSSSTCDVPNPPASCLLLSFNPATSNQMLKIVVAGGAISLRIVIGGISVHYANVDLLASGPPSSDFESTSTTSTTGGFSTAAKFGSQGPTIYDYVLISFPYTQGTVNQTGLDESARINLSIPNFYDESWTTPIWSSTNGTNAASLAGNFSHYSAYQSDWQTLMNSNNTCFATTTGITTINSSAPCHIQTADNKIWIRLPHFSGTQPSVTGSVITASSTAAADSGSSGGSASLVWTNSQAITQDQFKNGFTKEFSPKYRVTFNIANSQHSVGLISLTTTTATINISSTPQQKTLAIGEEWKAETTGDDYYDIFVKLNSIANNKASITIKSINEKIQAPQAPEEKKGIAETIKETVEGISTEVSKLNTATIVIIIIAVIAIVVLIYFAIVRKKKRYYGF